MPHQSFAGFRIKLIVAFALVSTGLAAPTWAQSYLTPNPPKIASDERFRLEVDVLYGGYDTTMRLDDVQDVGGVRTITPGTTISGEDDLGLPDTQFLGQVELTLLPGDHHLVRLSGLSMRRDGQTTLTRNISWDNDDYLAGERVDSHLHVSFVGLTYGYMPFRSDRYDLGLTFGLQVTSISANSEVRSRVIRESESAAAPLPMLGLEGRYEFSRRWSVDGRLQYFDLSLIEIIADIGEAVGLEEDAQKLRDELADKEGTIMDGRIAIRWRQNQHLIYGLGYRFFDMDLSATNSDPSGLFQLGMTGPILFVQASL